MGQSVSVDERLWELRDLLRMPPEEARPETGSPCQSTKRPSARQHVKVWQFTESGKGVAESPVALCNQLGVLNVEIRRCCSYLLLHVWSGGGGAGEEGGGAAAALLEELEAKAGAAFTPRGLAASPIVGSQGQCQGGGEGALRHQIYVWHGQDVGPQVKVRAFARAFELEAAMGNGLLRRGDVLEGLGEAVPLRGTSMGGGAANAAPQQGWPPKEGAAAGQNQLLQAILKGMPPTSAGGRKGGGRFWRLGKEIRASLGMQGFESVERQIWTKELKAQGQSLGLPSGRQLVADKIRVSVRTEQATAAPPAPAPVPRLALNMQIPIPGETASAPHTVSAEQRLSCKEEDNASMETDGSSDEEEGSGVGKRPRAKGAFPGRPAGLAPPKSARLGEVGHGGGAQPSPGRELGLRGNLVPALNLTAGAGGTGGQQRGTIADRLEAPTMLNLEEVNMSEEDLIRTYDPHNEENNYHLPDHLYKDLQLKHYRKTCSEVLANAVYLGGFQVAGDLECLQKHRITHIVNMAADVCENSFPEHFSYLTYYLKDTNSEEISPLFYRTLEWIQKAVEGEGRVLVHCREGVSRSATMVIAYLMWRLGLNFEAAHEKLQKARPICNPNTGFTCQLLWLAKRLGRGPTGGNAASAAPQLFRVAQHHPKEPFLLLAPSEWPKSWPHFDPRFGWVVLRGSQLLLWMGAQVPEHQQEPIQAAVQQHVRWVETFERRALDVSVTQQGSESPQLLQALAVKEGEAPPEACGLENPNPMYDSDFEVLCLGAASRNSELGGAAGRACGPYQRPTL